MSASLNSAARWVIASAEHRMGKNEAISDGEGAADDEGPPNRVK